MILLPIVIGLIGILPVWTPHIEADRAPVAQETEQLSTVRDITITARRYEFRPARIEVKHGDILRITLVAEDIAHSFTIDEYRISKRAAPGRSVTIRILR